ncbi:exonuclease SbcCD subunit D [Peribacillus alkalitolerans]|uniref:exonuclease SbcCD subunit D n=1 Tax=Peribacillus alkalitolerans TaxID=1550385 RepID=UPI0013D84F3E|nr:exonuclease SbcCD subunit D [Peribacillus alkalitolerans]
MKFIHTADWHLGKIVHGIHMTDSQRNVLLEFIKVVEEEKPDAIVIAGDLYDRSVPPTEAVDLLNEMLFTLNIDFKVPIVAISGNHDSAERLAFGNSWYRQSNFFMEGKVKFPLEPVEVNGVNFYMVPYTEPGMVRYALGKDGIHSHQEAMKAIVQEIEKSLDTSMPNVLVGHAFVLGGKETESERILSVGGSGCVTSDLFDAFSYTALGHLHSPDAIKHPTIYYSGSLLKYSFSEAKQRKSISIVEMQSDGQFSLRYRELTPEKDMRVLEGFIDELLDPSYYQQQKMDDFLKVILHDEGTILDPIHKLRQVYPNVLHLERKWDSVDIKGKTTFSSENLQSKSPLDLFENFYSEMTERTFSAEKKSVMSGILQAVKGEVENQ